MKKRTLQAKTLSLSDGLRGFLHDCRLRNLSPRTIEFYEYTNRKFILYKKDALVNNVRQEDISKYISFCFDLGMSDGGINAHIRSLRAFINYMEIPVKVKNIKQLKAIIVPFDEKQLKAIFKLPKRTTFAGLRDYAIMNILLDTGMRISEALNVCRKDILPGGQILVTGKGNKQRVVPIGRACQKALSEYLKAVVDIPEDKPIFVTVYNNQLTRNAFYKILKKYGELAGISGVRVSSHTFRHTFAKLYLLNGGDQFSLQDILGHESLDMVRRYVKMFASDLKEQHKKYSPGDSLFDATKRKLEKK